jgi:hypothetical protein
MNITSVQAQQHVYSVKNMRVIAQCTHSKKEVAMKKTVCIFAYLVLSSVSQANASPYPLGSMTCDDIGAFATQAMQWREDGIVLKDARVRLDGLRAQETVEKKNMRMVMEIVYGGHGDSWTVESAGNIMRVDCETGR